MGLLPVWRAIRTNHSLQCLQWRPPHRGAFPAPHEGRFLQRVASRAAGARPWTPHWEATARRSPLGHRSFGATIRAAEHSLRRQQTRERSLKTAAAAQLRAAWTAAATQCLRASAAPQRFEPRQRRLRLRPQHRSLRLGPRQRSQSLKFAHSSTRRQRYHRGCTAGSSPQCPAQAVQETCWRTGCRSQATACGYGPPSHRRVLPVPECGGIGKC